MSKVKITNSSGSSTVTLSAPNTSSDRTITLPDATGTLLTTDGDGSSLTSVPGGIDTDNLSDVTISTNYPSTSANPSATGYLHINKTSGEMWICTDATTDANVWFNVGNGTGNIS